MESDDPYRVSHLLDSLLGLPGYYTAKKKISATLKPQCVGLLADGYGIDKIGYPNH